ncbi:MULTISPECIES: hypothetical protein [Chromobacterium]|uniref:hypothetical protein n=1 Tax=Chromobacterium TaxID=535 RepID=UPI001E4218D2|nr:MULTISPECIES: hypothetical protein [Chromobacterium]
MDEASHCESRQQTQGPQDQQGDNDNFKHGILPDTRRNWKVNAVHITPAIKGIVAHGQTAQAFWHRLSRNPLWQRPTAAGCNVELRAKLAGC